MTPFNVSSIEQALTYLCLLLIVSVCLCLMQKAAVTLAIRYTGFRSIYPTAMIGTPIHELSHALFAVAFLHEIKSIKLFSPDKKTGVLGYVEHSHQASLYQKCGCFFIGIAPMFGGALAIYVINELFFPSMNQEIIQNTFSQSGKELSLVEAFLHYISLLNHDFGHLLDNFGLKHIVWLFLVSSIALHMGPSRADLRNSVPGLISLMCVCLSFYFISPGYFASFVLKLSEVSAFLTRMLFFALVLTLVPICLMYMVKEFKVAMSKFKQP